MGGKIHVVGCITGNCWQNLQEITSVEQANFFFFRVTFMNSSVVPYRIDRNGHHNTYFDILM